MPKRPPQSQFGGNLPTYLQNKASSSQFTYFFGDSMEIRQKNWHSQKNTELSSNFDGFGGKLGEKTHKQKCKKSPPGKIGAESTYLPTSGIMSVTFFFHPACNRHTKPTTHATKLPPGPIPSTGPPTQPQYGAVVRRAGRATARWLRGGVRVGRWATPRGDRDRTAHHAKMKTNSRRRSEMTSSA